MKVQIVGSNEDRTSLTDEVLEAIKPRDYGTLLRLDFSIGTRGLMLRFRSLPRWSVDRREQALGKNLEQVLTGDFHRLEGVSVS